MKSNRSYQNNVSNSVITDNSERLRENLDALRKSKLMKEMKKMYANEE